MKKIFLLVLCALFLGGTTLLAKHVPAGSSSKKKAKTMKEYQQEAKSLISEIQTKHKIALFDAKALVGSFYLPKLGEEAEFDSKKVKANLSVISFVFGSEERVERFGENGQIKTACIDVVEKLKEANTWDKEILEEHISKEKLRIHQMRNQQLLKKTKHLLEREINTAVRDTLNNK